MKIINQTRQTTLAQTAIEAKSLIDQTLGLFKHKTPTAMIINTRFGIHTFFMNYPIDVIVLDQQNCIVKIQENLQPNQLFFWHPKYNTLIELPAGVIKQSKTKVGDTITV